MQNKTPSDQVQSLSVNQSVHLGQGIQGTTNGMYTNGEIIVRVKIPENKQDEKYLKKFNSLTPKANLSRLYLVPFQELLRHNEQKRQTPVAVEKRTRRKS